MSIFPWRALFLHLRPSQAVEWSSRVPDRGCLGLSGRVGRFLAAGRSQTGWTTPSLFGQVGQKTERPKFMSNLFRFDFTEPEVMVLFFAELAVCGFVGFLN